VARARCILLNDSNITTGNSIPALTDEDIEYLYGDLEEAIILCEAEEIYMKAFIDLVVNRVKEEGGKDMVQTVHDLLFLAWRVNQGISCFHHADPRSRPPIHIQGKLVQAIEELDNIGKKCGYEWCLNHQGRSDIRILNDKDIIYHRIRHLADYESQIIDPEEIEEEYQDESDY